MRFKLKFEWARSYSSWYLTPSVRLGWWDHRDCNEGHGGWLGLCWIKADLCLTWKSQDAP